MKGTHNTREMTTMVTQGRMVEKLEGAHWNGKRFAAREWDEDNATYMGERREYTTTVIAGRAGKGSPHRHTHHRGDLTRHQRGVRHQWALPCQAVVARADFSWPPPTLQTRQHSCRHTGTTEVNKGRMATLTNHK